MKPERPPPVFAKTGVRRWKSEPSGASVQILLVASFVSLSSFVGP